MKHIEITSITLMHIAWLSDSDIQIFWYLKDHILSIL